MLNLVKKLQKYAVENPEAVALLFLENGKEATSRITYGELDERARKIAGFLQQNGFVEKNILLLYPAGLEFITAFLGCLYARVIPVPVTCPRIDDFERSSQIINTIAEDAQIAGVLTLPSMYESIKQVCSDVIAKNIIELSGGSKDYQIPKFDSNSIAYLQYTSGSTSTPKGVIISHKGLTHNLHYSGQVWHYTKKSVSLTWAPHTHIYGLVCGLLVPLYHGSVGIIMAPDIFIRRPLNWLEAISQFQVTHSGCPNFGYELCANAIAETELNINLKSWQVAVNGGENVQLKTLKKFADKFAKVGFSVKSFCSAYGMSEFTGTIAVTPFGNEPNYFNLSTEALKKNQVLVTENSFRTFVSNGKLIHGVEAKIVNPETFAEVGENEIGEIWLTGNSLARGYWQKDEETKLAFRAKLSKSKKNYFRTGDLGFINQGEICLTGRLKEVIVIHGKKYYPLDLETTVAEALVQFPVGHYHTAFSCLIEEKEEIIFIQEIQDNVKTDTRFKMINEINNSIFQKLGLNVYGIILAKNNSLPRTSSGKLQRKLCYQYFLEGKLEIIEQTFKNKKTIDVQHNNIHKDFHERFLDAISTVLKIAKDTINLHAPLSEYRLDSITVVQLITRINETFNLSLTPVVLFQYNTMGDFLNDLMHIKTDRTHLNFHNNYLHKSNDIAIIGMSGIFPGAPDIPTFWENMIKGKDAITEIPKERWDWQNISTIKWGGFVNEIALFDAEFFNISKREAELTDPQQRLFLQIVWNTVEDAGYTAASLSKQNTGIFVGVFNNDYAELLQKNNIVDAYVATGITHSILANRVSYLLNWHGPCEAIDTACSSSLVAIHHAIRAIQNGECEVAIAGGVNAILTPSVHLIANKAGMLSQEGRCKTFDKNANGYVRSEGAAAILLKSLEQAIIDGDHIYAVIKGIAVNHGGHVNSLTVPNPNAQAEVIAHTCRLASIDINTINFIETHGTGTSLGDPVEINGLKKAFEILNREQNNKNSRKSFCGLGAVKTHVGHLEAAAGITGVIKTVLAMQHKLLPGNLHFQEINPYIEINDSPFYLITQNQAWERLFDENGNEIPRRAGVSSFGYGGTNAHIILEEAPSGDLLMESSPLPHLITLSAKTDKALQQRIQNLHDWLVKQMVSPSIAALSYTLNLGRTHFDKRCVIVAETITELQESLTQLLQGKKLTNCLFNNKNSQKIDAIFYESYPLLMQDLKTTHIQDYRNKLLALGNFYTEGYDLDWNALHHLERKRISLPTYPFAKEYYWLPEATQDIQVIQTQSTELSLLTQIQQTLIQQISNILKKDASLINLNSSLSELGFDSIAFKELALKLENYYQLELNPSLFFTHNNIQMLSEHLITLIKEPIPTLSALPVMKTISTEEPIAIVGMQGYFPQSKDLKTFWQHLLAGDDLITEVSRERWDWNKYYGDSKQDGTKTNSKWGGFITEIDQFDAAFFNISSREANLMDPQHRLMMEIVWKTIEDAGYDPFSLSKSDTGLFVGIEFSEYQNLIHQQKINFHGHVATGTSHALLANRISYFLNLHGPSEVVDTACSSSLVAIHRAVNALRNGECSAAIAGGVSLMLDPDTFVITSQLGALSPDGRCKTFDKSANGYVKGEGVAALLLKPLSQAEKAGDSIYGIIKASVVNHGGKAQSLTAPNASAQSELLIKTYQQAQINPDTISYIETHGTGTELGDPIEIEGLKQAFKSLMTTSKEGFCALGALKTNIGHLEPASGIASVIKVLLAMQHGKIPGNLHQIELNPYINLVHSPFYIPKETKTWERLVDENGTVIPFRAGVSSFGFGGTNAHILIEENSNLQKKNPPIKPYYLLTLSAKTEISLKQKAVELLEWLNNYTDNINLSALCFTLNVGRTHFDLRCAIVVDTLDHLKNSLKDLIANQPNLNCIITTNATTGDKQSPVYKEIYQTAITSLLQNEQDPKIYQEKILILADLYVKHFDIEWNLLYPQEKCQRLASMPTYPFNKQRYWFDTETPTNQQQSTIHMTIAPTNKMMDLKTFTINYLQQIFAEKLQLTPSQISIEDTYEIYGVDSLIGLEITNRLEQDFPGLSKTILYERSKIRDLAAFLIQKFSDKFQKLYQPDSNSVVEFVTHQPIPPKQQESKEYAVEDIAIIGLSGTFPLAKDMDEFWDNLIQGRNCITEIPSERWNYQEHPVSVGGEQKYFKYGGFIPDVDKFDPLFFGIAPREASLMDPQERIFMQSVWTTIEDAGYTREKLRSVTNNNVGVFAGVTYNFYPLFIAEEWRNGNQLPLDIQMFSVANRISYFMDFNGPSFVVDTACSSSLAAIHLACESIARGECIMAIAGGVNLSLHPSKYHFLGGYGFLSEKGQCASFAEGGTGYVPAEGVGAILLKPLALALRDRDRIYGIIKSSSMNHGGKTSGYTVPNPNAQAELIKTALEKAKINPRTITYIEAHGTGTALGDPIEVRGLQDAFEAYTDDKQFCAIGSVKSNIGHLESAAGISQLAKVLLQMKHKKLVASIHTEKLNPFIDFEKSPFYVQRELTDWQPLDGQPRRAGISSFGAGGTNVHIIVEEFITPPEFNPAIAGQTFIFLLSAINTERLHEYAQIMHEFLCKTGSNYSTIENLHHWLHNVCYTSQTGRESMTARLAIIASDYHDLMIKLKKYLDQPDQFIESIFINSSAKQTQSPHVSELIHQKNYRQLVSLWIAGTAIAWETLYDAYQPQRIPIPTYPFAKRRCWVSSPTETKAVPAQPIVVTEQLKIISSQVPTEIIPKKLTPSLDRDEVINLLVNLLSQLLALELNEIEFDVQFLNYGLDSIIGINFVGEINKKFPEILSPMDLYRYPTVNLLADYIVSTYQTNESDLAQPTTAANTPLNEDQFMQEIGHLSDAEVAKLLEQEILEIDNLK